MQLNLTPSCNHSVITIYGNTGMRKDYCLCELGPLYQACASTDSQVIVYAVLDIELFWNAKDLPRVSRVDTSENNGVLSRIVYRVSHN